MSEIDDDIAARRVDRYGREVAPSTGTPGRATMTSRMPASARAIARAVMAEMQGTAADRETKVARAAESSGHALPDGLRGRFEQSLGADLGGVRVHTDGAAADAATALGARAYATGQDVFMGAGQYAPDRPDGAALLAHEVAHTVQQRGAAAADPACKLDVSEPGDAMELEADAAALAMMSGLPARVSSFGGLGRRIARVIEAPHPGGGAADAARVQGRIEMDTGVQMALGQYFRLEHVRFRIQYNGEYGHSHAAHPAAGVSGSSMGTDDQLSGHPGSGNPHTQNRVTANSTTRNGAREDSISVQQQRDIGDAFHHLLRFRATGGASIGQQQGTATGYLYFGGAAELGSLMSLDLQFRLIERARNSRAGQPDQQDGEWRFANLRAALMTNPMTLRYSSPDGWYLQGSFQIGLECRIAPVAQAWIDLARRLTGRGARIATEALEEGAGNAGANGAAGGGGSGAAEGGGSGAAEGGGGGAAEGGGSGAAEGGGGGAAEGGGGGAVEGGGGAVEGGGGGALEGGGGSALEGGGGGATATETGTGVAMGEILIPAAFIAGAVLTVATAIGSLMEMDDADAAARQVPVIDGHLVDGYLAGLRGDERPSDRTHAVGWEQGHGERSRIVQDAVRRNHGTTAADFEGAVTELADERADALRARLRPQFWRLAQAIAWHAYARRQHGLNARHALDTGWMYIFQGAQDEEVRRLYNMYADHL